MCIQDVEYIRQKQGIKIRYNSKQYKKRDLKVADVINKILNRWFDCTCVFKSKCIKVNKINNQIVF